MRSTVQNPGSRSNSSAWWRAAFIGRCGEYKEHVDPFHPWCGVRACNLRVVERLCWWECARNGHSRQTNIANLLANKMRDVCRIGLRGLDMRQHMQRSKSLRGWQQQDEREQPCKTLMRMSA